MPRNRRVLSFMSQWGGGNRSPDTSAPSSPTVASPVRTDSPPSYTNGSNVESPTSSSPRPPRGDDEKRHSRSSSMVMSYQQYQAPVMETSRDIPPELQPIFTFLSGHQNKLYQEGYFLKLHDLDSRGRPSNDRQWSECFAQLVGTVLSLWDAAALDAAGEDGEVMPAFINLTDASIKMIESLPMNGLDGQALENVLSISTAANNRYLLHFNSLHSLTQWTAGIRLAMYEYAALQEAYTGSIIAGKGKHLNSIRTIMERSRFPTEDWARVRFGAGTPWRRCWCVITPPDEKEIAKVHKLAKKRSAYEKAPVVRGDLKFYETRKVTKKTRPIATIKNAYAAYAVYPQAKELINQSTLIKLEGIITIHATNETTTEGFVFLMPEVHPAVTGFEIMIRWLIPTFDTFALYGRPMKLVADLTDTRSLMFAMPSGRRYGYLDLIDVAGLIHTEGSENWSEREWRKQLKLLVSKRMMAPDAPARAATGDERHHSRQASSSSDRLVPKSNSRSSLQLPSQGPSVKFGDAGRSAPTTRQGSPSRDGAPMVLPHRNVSDTSLPNQAYRQQQSHQRASSDAYRPAQSSRLSSETARQNGGAPAPPPHRAGPPPPPQHGYVPVSNQYDQSPVQYSPQRDRSPNKGAYQLDHPINGDFAFDDNDGFDSPGNMFDAPITPLHDPPQPVAAPPAMSHKSNAQPARRPPQRPDMLRENSAIDPATLAQMRSANPAGSNQQGPIHEGPYLHSPNGQMYNPQYPSPSGQPSPTSMRQAGPPSSNNAIGMPDRRLPTIPGTPAFEQDNFQLDSGISPGSTQRQNAPPLSREKSSGSIVRKPVPGRG